MISTAHFEFTLLFVTDGFAPVPQWISDVGKKKKQSMAFDQASAVPYRFDGDNLEFCLITTSSKRRWCLPKGIIDPGERPEETAVKEADEEGGLEGEICGPPLGSYKYHKWGRKLHVVVFLMKVHEARGDWEEAHLRDRRWVHLEEAVEMLSAKGLERFVGQAVDRLEVGVRRD